MPGKDAPGGDEKAWGHLDPTPHPTPHPTPTHTLSQVRPARHRLNLLFPLTPPLLLPLIRSALRGTAYIHHLIGDGSLGEQYAHAFGALPFRGHRQRLDRYDETDFETYVAASIFLLTPTPTPTAPTPKTQPKP